MKDFKHWSKNSDSLVIPLIIFYISQNLYYDLHKDSRKSQEIAL